MTIYESIFDTNRPNCFRALLLLLTHSLIALEQLSVVATQTCELTDSDE